MDSETTDELLRKWSAQLANANCCDDFKKEEIADEIRNDINRNIYKFVILSETVKLAIFKSQFNKFINEHKQHL